jgi:ribonuclease-3
VSGAGKNDPRAQAIAELEARLDYVFDDRALLDRALTHASVSGLGKHVQQNETLEFLGDRVLGLLTAERLMQLHPDEREGALSNRLHGVVSREACARVGRRIGLADAVRRAGISTRKPTAAADTVLADACEALLGALYLDIWAEEIEAAPAAHSNPKNELQELMLKRGRPAPRYRVVDQQGPAHAPVFTIEVEAEGAEPVRAVGRSRQDGEKAAAKAMLEQESLR